MLGTTKVECTAEDAAGFTDSGSFDVIVTLGEGSGITSNKRSVKAGAVAGFSWVWEDAFGNTADIVMGSQEIEAWLGNCGTPGLDVLNEDPGSSMIRQLSDGSWTFNWQTVDENTDPIGPGDYCVRVTLMTSPYQFQSTMIKVRAK